MVAVKQVERGMIGRTGNNVNITSLWGMRSRTQYTVDSTRANYQFWDRLRRGEAAGYKLGGMFADPITQLLALTVMGRGLSASLVDSEDEYTAKQLSKFLKRNQRLFVSLIRDLYALGDTFCIINPDGTLSVPSPDTVTPMFDVFDYRKLVKVTITTRLPDATITDTYTETNRVIVVKWTEKDDEGKIIKEHDVTEEFDNLIGRLPVVHFANERGTNELFGRPVYEALLYLFAKYDDIMESSVRGVQVMANPIPAFEGMKDPEKTKEANATHAESVKNADGETETVYSIEWDMVEALFIGEGGEFNFKGPGAFTDNATSMLKFLFYLMLQRSRIPEIVWGGEMGQSRASSIDQVTVFEQHIEGRRIELEGEGPDPELGLEASGGLLAVIDIWLTTRKLTDSKIQVVQVELQWAQLSDMEGQLKLSWTQWADNTGRITKVTGLRLSGLVDDPEAEIERADEEAEERRGQTNNPPQDDPAPDQDDSEDASQGDEPEDDEAEDGDESEDEDSDANAELIQWQAVAVKEGVAAAMNFRASVLDEDIQRAIRFNLTALTESGASDILLCFDTYRRLLYVQDAA